MIETKVTITRGAAATVIQRHVDVQIDTKNPMLAAYFNHDHPYDVFDAYIKYAAGYVILRSDLLTDEGTVVGVNIDPLTNAATAYRVVGKPQAFPDGHVECVVDAYVGAQS